MEKKERMALSKSLPKNNTSDSSRCFQLNRRAPQSALFFYYIKSGLCEEALFASINTIAAITTLYPSSGQANIFPGPLKKA